MDNATILGHGGWLQEEGVGIGMAGGGEELCAPGGGKG